MIINGAYIDDERYKNIVKNIQASFRAKTEKTAEAYMDKVMTTIEQLVKEYSIDHDEETARRMAEYVINAAMTDAENGSLPPESE